jgi:hypothetical protein
MVYNSRVNVKVEAGTLWIGGSAYPLKQISSVQPIKYTYKQPATQRFSGCAVLVAWFVLAGVLGGALSAAHLAPLDWLVQLMLIAGAVLVYVKGRTPERSWTYYRLHIGSGGVQQVVLNVASEDVAQELTRKITDAIDNPADGGFHMMVENLHFGDNNLTTGANSPINANPVQSPWSP